MAGASRAKAARLMSRWLGVGLSLNRIGFGSTYLGAPARGGRAWIGRAAGDPANTVIMRGHGALGCGGLSALARGDERGARIGAHVLADAVDFASTLAVRERLPPAAQHRHVDAALAATAGSCRSSGSRTAPRRSTAWSMR